VISFLSFSESKHCGLMMLHLKRFVSIAAATSDLMATPLTPQTGEMYNSAYFGMLHIF